MPYHIDMNNPRCDPTKPFAVVKDSNNEIMGCHATHEAAKAQLGALYANEPEAKGD